MRSIMAGSLGLRMESSMETASAVFLLKLVNCGLGRTLSGASFTDKN